MNWTKEAKQIWNSSEIIVFDAVKSFGNFYKNQGYKYYTGVLSDSDDKCVKFYQNKEHPAGNSYYKEIGHKNSHIIYPESNYTNEKTNTLSSVVKNLEFPMPDLIKFDVQGAELDIIKGSLDIITHAKYLIVEIQNKQYNKNAPLLNETINFLEMNGWELVTKKPFCNNGPDGDYCFTKRNKLSIFNSLHYHYEMFGFILNYALKGNGVLFETTFDKSPIEITIGQSNLPQIIEAALYGMGCNEKKEYKFSSKDIFGVYDEKKVTKTSLKSFKNNSDTLVPNCL